LFGTIKSTAHNCPPTRTFGISCLQDSFKAAWPTRRDTPFPDLFAASYYSPTDTSTVGEILCFYVWMSPSGTNLKVVAT